MKKKTARKRMRRTHCCQCERLKRVVSGMLRKSGGTVMLGAETFEGAYRFRVSYPLQDTMLIEMIEEMEHERV